MKVLLIDDEEDIRRIARLGLSRVGKMEVVEASSGLEGLRLAAAERPDVILLDMMMPVMDGPATLFALKAAVDTRSIPVVFLTAKSMASEQQRLLSLGAAGVLLKPFDPMTLADQLRSVLRGA